MRLSTKINGFEFWCSTSQVDGVITIKSEDFPELIETGKDHGSCLERMTDLIRRDFQIDNRTEHQFRVELFMRLMARFNELQAVRYVPTDQLLDKIILLRARLILEEVFELVEKGLGVDVFIPEDGNLFDWNLNALEFKVSRPVNLSQVVDGITDSNVVINGTAAVFGVGQSKFQEIVDRNNLKKFDTGFRINEHGKLIKSPNHAGPEEEINEELRRQGFQPGQDQTI